MTNKTPKPSALIFLSVLCSLSAMLSLIHFVDGNMKASAICGVLTVTFALIALAEVNNINNDDDNENNQKNRKNRR